MTSSGDRPPGGVLPLGRPAESLAFLRFLPGLCFAMQTGSL
jgi:hypothetical protein